MKKKLRTNKDDWVFFCFPFSHQNQKDFTIQSEIESNFLFLFFYLLGCDLEERSKE